MTRLFPLLLVGCVPPALVARLDALQQEVATLRTELKAEIEQDLEQRLHDRLLTELRPGPPPAPPSGSPDEGAAMAEYKRAAELGSAGHPQEAVQVLQALRDRYPHTRAASAAERLQRELSVVGKQVGPLKDIEWYQGSGDWSVGTATLVVFWEVWCPHCKREMPRLEPVWQAWKSRGLQVIGLTKLSRGKTPDEVRSFILENGITYPIGKEDGDLSDLFSVTGVPAAAVVRDGVVIWRGHPASIEEDMLADWVGLPDAAGQPSSGSNR